MAAARCILLHFSTVEPASAAGFSTCICCRLFNLHLLQAFQPASAAQAFQPASAAGVHQNIIHDGSAANVPPLLLHHLHLSAAVRSHHLHRHGAQPPSLARHCRRLRPLHSLYHSSCSRRSVFIQRWSLPSLPRPVEQQQLRVPAQTRCSRRVTDTRTIAHSLAAQSLTRSFRRARC